jgi:hypothetical protein
LLVLLTSFGERIDVNRGAGLDGLLYVQAAEDPWRWLGTATQYTVQRVFPSVVVHYLVKAAGVDPAAGTRRSHRQIVTGFRVLNALLLVLSAYVWCLTADLLQIRERGKWLGFTFLFVNFATLKLRHYYAPLTDYSAYTLGILMLYFYLRRSTFGVFFSTLAGVFTWPGSLPLGVLLLLFPRPSNSIPRRSASRWQSLLDLLAAAVLTLLVCLGLRFAIATVPTTTEIVRPVLNLSIGLALIYSFYAARPLISLGYVLDAGITSMRELKQAAGVPVVLCGVAVGLRLLQLQLTEPWGFTPRVEHLIVLSIVYPAVFYVAHVVWFGPVVILGTFLWPRVGSLIRDHGLGLTSATLLGVLLSLDSESRVLSAVFPFIVPFVVKSIESLDWANAQYWLLAALSVLISKVWLTIGPIADSLPFEMPGQLYYMNFGPWMTPATYLAQASATAAVAWLLFDVCIRHRGSGIPVAPSQPPPAQSCADKRALADRSPACRATSAIESNRPMRSTRSAACDTLS